MKKSLSLLLTVWILAGCASSSNAPPPQTPEPESVPAQAHSARPAVTETATHEEEEGPVESRQPNLKKVQAHLSRKLRYPASAGQVLDSISLDPELTAGERQWIGENLPQGVYRSPEDVTHALGGDEE